MQIACCSIGSRDCSEYSAGLCSTRFSSHGNVQPQSFAPWQAEKRPSKATTYTLLDACFLCSLQLEGWHAKSIKRCWMFRVSCYQWEASSTTKPSWTGIRFPVSQKHIGDESGDPRRSLHQVAAFCTTIFLFCPKVIYQASYTSSVTHGCKF